LNIFGFSVSVERRKAAPRELSSVYGGRGGWFPLVREPFTGAWQRNLETRAESLLTYSAVFSCINLISSDVAKLRIRLVEQGRDGIWREVERESPFWPVLRKPNNWQSRIQFFASWIQSKLIHGNTYILKERDNRGGTAPNVGVVRRLYVLDPTRVRVLVAPDSSVYYELNTDHLSGIEDHTVVVPASEIIHDHWNEFYHPLVGISPLSAAGLAASQGMKIQESSTAFFAGGANPGGILTAPGEVAEADVIRLQEFWNSKYGPGGSSVGAVAVLGSGLEYKPMQMTSTDAQLIEQLKWTSETVCSVLHVPPHMIGIGQPPTYNNIEALNQQYYSQCLQVLLEAIEVLLDEGLELKKSEQGLQLGTEFDLDGLLRMDTPTKVKAAADALKAGGMSPNEARMRYFDLGPTEGGDSPYLQIQNYSLEALARRDAETTPVTPGLEQPPTGTPTAQPAEESEADGGSPEEDDGDATRFITADRLVDELHEWTREADPAFAA
jgi:HK97 family phage portal protein